MAMWLSKSRRSFETARVLRLANVITDSQAYPVAAIGTRIDKTGALLRERAAFVLRRDLGGRRVLDLRHVPVNHVEKRVRITGTIVGDGLVDVDSLVGQAKILRSWFFSLSATPMSIPMAQYMHNVDTYVAL